jgi:hypothetical protein
MNIRSLTFATAAALSLALVPPAVAAGKSFERDSLRGIRAISVVVDSPPKLDGFPLETAALKTQVELELRKAGIRVDDTALTLLAVNVTAIEIRLGEGAPRGWAVDIDVHFNQVMTLLRSPEVLVPAATWTTGGVAVWSRDMDGRGAKDMVIAYVDQFANDFLAANPPSPKH